MVDEVALGSVAPWQTGDYDVRPAGEAPQATRARVVGYGASRVTHGRRRSRSSTDLRFVRAGVVTPEDRRGLRGFVNHVLPVARKYRPAPRLYPRGIIGPVSGAAKSGICRWCGLPIADGKRKRWHQSCVHWYMAARGQTVNNLAPLLERPVVPPTACALCGSATAEECDHLVALAVAARQGVRQWVRAHQPSNLRWLCHECHAGKTGEDRRLMSRLDKAARTAADGHVPLGL